MVIDLSFIDYIHSSEHPVLYKGVEFGQTLEAVYLQLLVYLVYLFGVYPVNNDKRLFLAINNSILLKHLLFLLALRGLLFLCDRIYPFLGLS